MARRVREHDWAATALGSSDTWPGEIRAVVELVLASPLVSTLTLTGQRFLIYNDRAAALYGAHHPGALGRPLSEAFADTYPTVARHYDKASAGESVRVAAQELHVGNEAESEVFDAYLTPVRAADGAIIGVHMVGLEIGVRIRADTVLRDSEERLRLIVENARDYAIFTVDTQARVTDWREGAEDIFGYSPAEIVGLSADVLYTPEDNEAGEPTKERALAAQTGKAPNVRWHIRKDGRPVFIEGVCTALHDADGGLSSYLKIGRDATARHSSEERQRLLLAELQHRVRNILAMIRSIVRQSSDAHDDVDDYVSHLVGRLDAMARTQLVLTRSAGAKVNLEDLVRDELQSQIADAGRVVVAGPEVLLSPKAAEVLTLALHELGTNAMKYGALSDSEGRLTVGWQVDMRDSSPWLRLIWSERSSQARHPAPSRDGFGSELIRERVPYELRGTARLDFAEHGVVATIMFPMTEGSSILETGPAGKLRA